MKKVLLLLIAFSFFVTSCSKDDVPGTSDRTVFMYLPWSTDLLSFFQTNITDMESAIKEGVLNNERVLVFLHTSPTEATLFELSERGEKGRKVLKNYTDIPFTTADGITSILNDVKAFSPAHRYAMTIGCHGLGWIPVSSGRSLKSDEKMHWEYGESLTRYFGGLSPQYQTDIITLAEAITNAGIKMEYILFDDCYMSTVEVAYELRNVTDYFIASPTEILKYGMPYHKIGRYMFGNVDYESITDAFLSFYENYTTPCGTIGVTVCSELEGLVAIMKEINDAYPNELASSLLGTVQRMDGYSPVIFFDLSDYVSKLCKDPELLERFEAQLERVIPSKYRKHTDTYFSNARGETQIKTYTGLTISDPSKHSLASAKTETSWYKATHSIK